MKNSQRCFKKPERGFIMTLFLPLLTVLMTGLLSFALTAAAVKKRTESQSSCLKAAVKAQKTLSGILKKLLALNKASRALNFMRGKLAAAKKAALLTANITAYKAAGKALQAVEIKQKTLKKQQEALTEAGKAAKAAALKELRLSLKGKAARKVHDASFSQKSLAVQKIRIGKSAFIYKPDARFSKQQSIRLSWELNPFAGPLLKDGRLWLGFSKAYVKDDCAATLEKTAWEARLSP